MIKRNTAARWLMMARGETKKARPFHSKAIRGMFLGFAAKYITMTLDQLDVEDRRTVDQVERIIWHISEGR